jgi:hypothetical protein
LRVIAAAGYERAKYVELGPGIVGRVIVLTQFKHFAAPSMRVGKFSRRPSGLSRFEPDPLHAR